MKRNLLGGAKQQETFEKIKQYLSSPPVLKTPRRGFLSGFIWLLKTRSFELFLTQETEDKEYVIIYISRRLIDAETRYTFTEKLCLSLYYACTKLRHYLLSSSHSSMSNRCAQVYATKADFKW